jgi:hypothetical protein
MATLKVSYTDTTSEPLQISVNILSSSGKADANNPKNNPQTLNNGDSFTWTYTGEGAGCIFTVQDSNDNGIPELTKRDAGKLLPLEDVKEDGYSIYINDPKNPPSPNDIIGAGDPPENGVKVTRP